MQCGAVRHRVDAKAQAAARRFEHKVIVRPTAFQSADSTGADKRIEFQTLYRCLVEGDTRNRVICEEIAQAVSARRSLLVLTERNEHLDRFESALSASVPHVVVREAEWVRSSGEQRPNGWRLSRWTKVASSLRLASTWERDSTIRAWTRCF
jgi:hypothetical protein